MRDFSFSSFYVCASLKQLFTYSLMNCLMHAYHKSTKRIISRNTTGQTEAPKQSRGVNLLVERRHRQAEYSRQNGTGTACESVQNCLCDFLPPPMTVALLSRPHISLLTDNSEASCQWPHYPTFFPLTVCQNEVHACNGRQKLFPFALSTLRWFAHVMFSFLIWGHRQFKRTNLYWQGSCLCKWGFREGLSPTFCTIFCMLLSHNSVKKNVKCLLDNSFGFVTVYICRMWMYFLHVFCL